MLLLTQHFFPEENVPAIRWYWLANGLVQRGFDVEVLTATWGKGGKELLQPHLVVNRVPGAVAGKSVFSRLLNELVVATRSLTVNFGKTRPDLIIATGPPLTTLVLADLLSRRYRRPLVCDLRDAWPELLDQWQQWGDDGIRPVKKHRLRNIVLSPVIGVLKQLLLAIQRRSKLMVTTSEYYAEAIKTRVSGEIIWIRNTPEIAVTKPTVDDHNKLRILYLGNIGRAQKLATAIRAAALAAKAGANIELRIVGDGAQLSVVRTLAKRLKAPVEFYGRVPRAEVAQQYQWADTILVMLRNWQPLETTVPSKLYDALASGKYICASLAGESAEIISRTGAGDVVAPEDAEGLAALWVELANNRDRLLRRDNNEWLLENTNKDKLANEYADALSNLLKN